MSFDAIARPYRVLEAAAFGKTLQRARTAWLDEARSARRALIVGEGDGRFLRALLIAAPAIEVDCVDASTTMLELARTRAGAGKNVRFLHADATTLALDCTYDLVVTNFVLDCFDAQALGRLVPRLASHLSPNGRWIHSDFTLPARGFQRARAAAWLAVMYRFFGLVAGLRTRQLVSPTPLFEESGLVLERSCSFEAAFVCAQLWRKADV